MVYLKGRYKSTDTIPEKDLVADKQDKNFKKNIEDIQRNKDVEKIKKMIHEQNKKYE